MELHKRRRALTEPEVQYLFQQTVLAVSYLHEVKVLAIYYNYDDLLQLFIYRSFIVISN